MNYMAKTVNVELHIDELMELVGYCNKMADSIPEEMYDQPTMSGTTFGDTVKKYRDRSDELYTLLNRAWPK